MHISLSVRQHNLRKLKNIIDIVNGKGENKEKAAFASLYKYTHTHSNLVTEIKK